MSAHVTDRTRSRRLLVRGILVFRWATLAWMAVLALTSPAGFARPVLAWGAVAATVAWTAWLTVARHEPERAVLGADLGVCLCLVLVSGLVMHPGEVVGERPFFATGYPLAAVLLWSVTRGPSWGAAAAGVLGAGLVAARPLNGVALGELSAAAAQQAAGDVVYYLVPASPSGWSPGSSTPRPRRPSPRPASCWPSANAPRGSASASRSPARCTTPPCRCSR